MHLCQGLRESLVRTKWDSEHEWKKAQRNICAKVPHFSSMTGLRVLRWTGFLCFGFFSESMLVDCVWSFKYLKVSDTETNNLGLMLTGLVNHLDEWTKCFKRVQRKESSMCGETCCPYC